MKKISVLFVYPNRETILRIPLGPSLLCSAIKEAGHAVHVLDTTFTGGEFKTDIHYSEKKGTVQKSSIEDHIGQLDSRPLDMIIREAISSASPDLIAVSLLERNFTPAKIIIEQIKNHCDAPVLIGGILPTISPETVIAMPGVDMICIGEGEGAIVDVCNAVAHSASYTSIPNIWSKQDGTIYRNPLRPLENLNSLPEQDWDPFDRRHLLRAYKGTIHNNGSFEFSRGCNNACSFCVAPQLRSIQKNLGCYHRFKTPDRVIQEIKNKLTSFDLSLIHFGDTNFLSGMSCQMLDDFQSMYSQHIGLPFLIQTGAETITEEKLRILKKAGCDNISIGVESGSDRIRKKVIHKYVSKKRILETFRLGRKYKIRMTANYMLGLPDETEQDICETIAFNRRLNPPAISAFFFTPFIGTELYDYSLNKGYISHFNPDTNLHKESPLTMPQLPQQKIHELMNVFVDDFNRFKDPY